MRTRDQQTIGKIGESALAFWASQVGLITNKSDDDRAGWDYYLESPLQSANRPFSPSSSHQEVYPLRARVQVKATDGFPGYRDVELSNWARLVESPVPAFFVVFELDKGPTPVNAYVVHVDEVLITQALQRIHETREEGHPLHKATMRFRYSEAHKVHKLNGEGLLEKLLEPLRDSSTDYAIRKMSLCKSAGYEHGNCVVVATLPKGTDLPRDSRKLAADFEVGIIDKFVSERVEVYPLRFGIRGKEPLFSGGMVEISMGERRPAQRVTVAVEVAGSENEARFRADLYMSNQLARAVKESRDLSPYSFRVVAPCIDIVMPVKKGQCTLSLKAPEFEERVLLRDIKQLADTILTLNDAVALRNVAAIEVSTNQGKRTRFEINPDVLGDSLRDGVDLASAVNHMWNVAHHFKVEDVIEVSRADLSANLDFIEWMHNVITGKASGASVDFTYSPQSDAEVREGNEETILQTEEVNIGSHRLAFVLRFKGNLSVISEPGQDVTCSMQGAGVELVAKRASELRRPSPISHFELMEVAAMRTKGRFLAIVGLPPDSEPQFTLESRSSRD